MRELLLKNLSALENWLAHESLDLNRPGYMTNGGSHTDTEYRYSLTAHPEHKASFPRTTEDMSSLNFGEPGRERRHWCYDRSGERLGVGEGRKWGDGRTGLKTTRNGLNGSSPGIR